MSASSGVDDPFMQEMLGDFLDESDGLLMSLNENLLKLDDWVSELTDDEPARCADDLMNELFRAAHSLKGLSAMLGLVDINGLTHKVENIFDAARNDRLAITSEVVELVFQSVDKLTGMIECLKDPSSEAVECDETLAKIQQLLQETGVERAQGSQEDITRALESAADISALEDLTEDTPPSTDEPQCDADLAPEPTVDHFADIHDETEFSEKYLSIFIDESDETLEALSETLLAEQGEKSTESLMILCHKVKGSAAAVGLNRAATLAHAMEDLLQELLQSGRLLTPEMADVLLRCADALRTFVDSLQAGESRSEHFNEVYAELLLAQKVEHSSSVPEVLTDSASSTSDPARPTDAASVDGVSDAIREQIRASAPANKVALIVHASFQEELPLAGLKGSFFYQRVNDIGPVFFCDPPEAELADLTELQSLTIAVCTEMDPEVVERTVQVEGIETLSLEVLPATDRSQGSVAAQLKQVEEAPSTTPVLPATAGQSSASAMTEKPAAGVAKVATVEGGKKPTETIRVDIDRLDQLMNLAGELVINKARFSQIGEGLKCLSPKQASNSLASALGALDRLTAAVDEAGQQGQHVDLHELSGRARRIRLELEEVDLELTRAREARNAVSELSEAVHQLERVSDGIQKSVMETRMVPIGPLFGRFKRVIRDITRGNGKDIRLAIDGENTELDKRMIDELGDPLIHMVRNSADHGIESPDEREAAGKPRQGLVALDAFHRGNSIVIEVRDDGKGLDPNKIRDKAIDKGIISQAEAEKMTPRQLFQLIWEPGLSTAEKVTEVSGRGMGMDIVRTKIEEINGAIELDSTVGVGTTVTIKLPLTLAILPSLMAKIDGDVFAMPIESVSEIVRVSEHEISTVHGLVTATVRGRVISVVNLSELFSWNQPPNSGAADNDDEKSLVIVCSDGKELGLVVDELLGEEDIVIKSLAENYRNVEGVAGACILGDGRVSLILDVVALLGMSTQHVLTEDEKEEVA